MSEKLVHHVVECCNVIERIDLSPSERFQANRPQLPSCIRLVPSEYRTLAPSAKISRAVMAKERTKRRDASVVMLFC